MSQLDPQLEKELRENMEKLQSRSFVEGLICGLGLAAIVEVVVVLILMFS